MSDLRTVTDQMGREVTFSSSPQRIVSLVPSQTEFLIDIGAPIVGRTKFCIHPLDKVKVIPTIGGTKNFRMEEIRRLNPDLIIGNKEENYREGIEELASQYPVWMSDINCLEDAFDMMHLLGDFCGKNKESEVIQKECRSVLDQVKQTHSGRVLYLIWKNPWMGAGKNTFVDHMLNHLGFQNVLQEDRYPMLTTEEIADLNPARILLSSEPFPFSDKHLEEAIALFPNAEVKLVDGELYSWYGSRLRYWSEQIN